MLNTLKNLFRIKKNNSVKCVTLVGEKREVRFQKLISEKESKACDNSLVELLSGIKSLSVDSYVCKNRIISHANTRREALQYQGFYRRQDNLKSSF